MNGLATRQLLKKLNHRRDDIMNGAASFGVPKRLIDPHDIEGRKWFRRLLIAACLLALAAIFMPDAMRQKLNAWLGTPTGPQRHASTIDTRLCINDWHERCLVCTHIDAAGQRVRSSHC